MSNYNEIINCGEPDWSGHVRKRPHLYIGKTDIDGLHRLITLLVESAFDQRITEGCTGIEVTLQTDHFVTARFNGSGISVEQNGEITFLERLLTKWIPEKQMRPHPLMIVNALSHELTIEVKRNGFLWRQAYLMGSPIMPVTSIRPLNKDETTGVQITFTPNFTVLDDNEFDYSVLLQQSEELIHQHKSVIFSLQDRRTASD
jgi:DNA gyrase subunit B